MTKLTRSRIFGFSGLVLLAGFAFADGNQTKSFDKLDQNQDGVLSAAEASSSADLSSQWTNVDADGSGSIDKAEFSAFETQEVEEPSDKSMQESEKEDSKY